MGTLRKKSKTSIEDALKASKFARHAFTIDDSPTDGRVFRISFDHDPEFRFDCYGQLNQWRVVYRPGSIMIQDERGVGGGFENVVQAVSVWLVQLDEDVDLLDTWSPHIRSINQQLEQFIGENPDSMSQRFTAEECEKLLADLRKLEKSYEALKEKHAITEEELEKLKATVLALENELSYVNRGTWYRLFIHRNLDVAEGLWKSPIVRQMALEAGKTFVQETVKTVLQLPAASTKPK